MRGLSYLAFAAGYRRISFVLIEDGELATWHTSCVAAQAPELAADLAKDFIDLLAPNVVVIEDVATAYRKGELARELLESIRKEAMQSNAQLLRLKRERPFRTKYDEAKYLAQLHPELADKIPQREFCEREPHHIVLFEALALAHQAMQGGTMLLASKM